MFEFKTNTMFIVRHGERLDEVPDHKWHEICKEHYGKTSNIYHYSRRQDPPLTSSGIEQGREVGRRLSVELGGTRLRCIYCSKLVRAVQTAYEIAKLLSVPIVLSEGFAWTALAVEKANGRFQYMEMEELVRMCPGVDLIDGDISTGNMRNIIPSIHTIPTNDPHWYSPLYHVGQQESSIVVAHRETIRNIANIRQPIPYCGYAIFQFPVIPDEYKRRYKIPFARMVTLRHPDGQIVEKTESSRGPKDKNTVPAKP